MQKSYFDIWKHYNISKDRVIIKFYGLTEKSNKITLNIKIYTFFYTCRTHNTSVHIIQTMYTEMAITKNNINKSTALQSSGFRMT